MKDQIKRLEAFHKGFNLHIGDAPSFPPTKAAALYYKLMREELDEFASAQENRDLPNTAHELADVMFVLLSAVVGHGFQDIFEDVFNEICDANMSKLGEDGKPIYREDGKVIRGSNYRYPDVESILKNHYMNSLVKDHVGGKL